MNNGNPFLVYDYINPNSIKSSRNNDTVKEKLKELFPPVLIVKEGNTLLRTASSKQCNNSKILKLNNDINRMLEERKAHNSGLCEIRQELFSQLFDELIRQVTIMDTYRGDLLFRIKEESFVTMKSYENLYSTVCCWSMSKPTNALEGLEEIMNENQELKEKVADLKSKYVHLENKMTEIQIKDKDYFEYIARKHEDHLVFLKKEKDKLISILDRYKNNK